ncbi:hypothetical protein [Xenorhabdus bovienii]|uniref:hypothetical protein n=1 Tax=Xenorhabdus bovienii TaxID=40576 RepID=UPI00237CFE30|nr:hypothetical protein [Xenorhabdus bovienii]MDE1493237.1 hypothetical protein [Xenorhabdus bovienii]MDE9448006.1 hypothetical protein [Xenorhabdus bovienii]
MGISDITYKTASWGEVKVDIYSGKNSDERRSFIEVFCDGDMESETIDEINFDSNRWPVGTKIRIEIPCCPECGLDAEFQDEEGACECGFDWRNWAEEQYS